MTEQVEAAMKIPDERVQKVGAFTGLTEDQVKRFVGCLLAVGLEIVESSKLPIPAVEEKAATSDDVRKRVLWEAAGIAENMWRDDDNRWNRCVRQYRDNIQKLVNAKPQPDSSSIPEQTFEEWYDKARPLPDMSDGEFGQLVWNAAKGLK